MTHLQKKNVCEHNVITKIIMHLKCFDLIDGSIWHGLTGVSFPAYHDIIPLSEK